MYTQRKIVEITANSEVDSIFDESKWKYANTKSNIPMMHLLPSIYRAYNLLLQDQETHKELSSLKTQFNGDGLAFWENMNYDMRTYKQGSHNGNTKKLWQE